MRARQLICCTGRQFTQHAVFRDGLGSEPIIQCQIKRCRRSSYADRSSQSYPRPKAHVNPCSWTVARWRKEAHLDAVLSLIGRSAQPLPSSQNEDIHLSLILKAELVRTSEHTLGWGPLLVYLPGQTTVVTCRNNT